ncbi:MAG: ACP phosphodiesterase [Candidatus Wallbacteria bacterium HGW-Wallbacteria-1]|jgi:FMN-dependent NADH-azoreductase|uniref:FMN dependent NADH:quinone oxidoreductase n=1 Tax=Candidatus Wallbacteria bacterium HGW-Wallbacteria-1 TaxID=2013854 RepID=A0A2N1PU06_9BACT|nr:MAG: ACP phosphodiesterase [Candidatus Wallbacteria bacterium HGW-Wallbacteria-1]
MNRILHIIASPRGDQSRSISLANHFIDIAKINYPHVVIEEIDLFHEELPSLTAETVSGKYQLMGGKDVPRELQHLWKPIVNHINRFLAADTVVITTPMWNFSIPHVLKHYIDIIFQPRYLFKYTEQGPQGLAEKTSVVVIATSGGDYSADSPFAHMDHLQPYLKSVFGFAGVKELHFITAQPMDAGGPEVTSRELEKGQKAIERLPIWKK